MTALRSFHLNEDLKKVRTCAMSLFLRKIFHLRRQKIHGPHGGSISGACRSMRKASVAKQGDSGGEWLGS